MIVITDMMGTLTTGSPILGFIDWVRQHQSKAKARWLTTQMMLGYLSAKAGLIDARKWQQNILIDSLDWIQAPSPAKLAEVSEWTVEHNLWPQRREDVIARLQAHVQQGAQVIIASSVFEPVAAAFGSRIRAQAIGTPLTYEGGRAHPAGELVSGERKIQEAFNRLGVSQVAYAYGDTEQDIPLLKHAEHPVAVYPNPELFLAAQERGWEIMGDPVVIFKKRRSSASPDK